MLQLNNDGTYTFTQDAAFPGSSNVLPTETLSDSYGPVTSHDYGDFTLTGLNGGTMNGSAAGAGVNDDNMNVGDQFKITFDQQMDTANLGVKYDGGGTVHLHWVALAQDGTTVIDSGDTTPFGADGTITINPTGGFYQLDLTVDLDSGNANSAKFKLTSIGGDTEGSNPIDHLTFQVGATDGDGDSVANSFQVHLALVAGDGFTGTVEEEELGHGSATFLGSFIGNEDTASNDGNDHDTGTPGGPGFVDNTTNVVTGTLTASGGVGAHTFSFDAGVIGTAVMFGGLPATSGGHALVYVTDGGGTLYGVIPDPGRMGDFHGFSSGDHVVFSITLNANGNYIFTLEDHLDHTPAGDNGENTLALDLSGIVDVTDSMGHTASVTGSVDIIDDVPVISHLAATGLGDLTVDESVGVHIGDPNANDEATVTLPTTLTDYATAHSLTVIGAATETTGVITDDLHFGADGPAATGSETRAFHLIGTDGNNIEDGTASGLSLSNGIPIFLFHDTQDGQDVIVGRGGENAANAELNPAAFAIFIDPVTGSLSMAQYHALYQGDTTNPDDSVSLNLGVLETVTITDGDGDTDHANRLETIHFNFEDDGPSINIVDPSPATVNETQTIDGTWTLDGGSDGVVEVDVSVGSVHKTLTLDPNEHVSIGSGDGFTLGTLTVNSDLTWSFTGGSVSSDAPFTFTLKATDLDGDPAQDTQTIDVTPINHPPFFLQPTSPSTAEDTTLVITPTTNSTFAILSFDPDAGDTASVVAGDFTTDQGGSIHFYADGGYTYTPALNFNGTDTVGFTVQDTHGASVTGTLTIDVTAVNDPPQIHAPASVTTAEDTAFTFSGANAITVSDIDAGTSGVQVQITSHHGALYLPFVGDTFADGFTGMVDADVGLQNQILAGAVFTPNANYDGQASIDVSVNDEGNTGTGGPLSASQTITIDVTPVKDPPVAVDDTAAVNEDTTLIVSNAANGVLANDHDPDAGDTLSVVAGDFTTAHGGSIHFNADGTYTYAPAANFNGTDTVDYTVKDIAGETDTGTLTITVNAVDDPPQIHAPASVTTAEDTAFTFSGANAITVSDIDAGTSDVQIQ